MRNGHKLKDFIDELLDYSRHELTRDSLHREIFSVRKVIDQAAAAMFPKLLERGGSSRPASPRGPPRSSPRWSASSKC